MKSIRLHGMRDVRIHDGPIPMAGAREKLVRIKAVGVCDSDLHWFLEREISDAKLDLPLILGHEFARGTENGRGPRLTLRSRAGIANFANWDIQIFVTTVVCRSQPNNIKS